MPAVIVQCLCLQRKSVHRVFASVRDAEVFMTMKTL